MGAYGAGIDEQKLQLAELCICTQRMLLLLPLLSTGADATVLLLRRTDIQITATFAATHLMILLYRELLTSSDGRGISVRSPGIG